MHLCRFRGFWYDCEQCVVAARVTKVHWKMFRFWPPTSSGFFSSSCGGQLGPIVQKTPGSVRATVEAWFLTLLNEEPLTIKVLTALQLNEGDLTSFLMKPRPSLPQWVVAALIESTAQSHSGAGEPSLRKPNPFKADLSPLSVLLRLIGKYNKGNAFNQI